MESCHALIRVRVPDRPGALGLVASRIGALKSDIIGISVLDRADGAAIDELAVVIPDADLIPALHREIEEVDGVEVESIAVVDHVPEPRVDVLDRAVALARATSHPDLAGVLTHQLQEILHPEWLTTSGPGVHVERNSATGAAVVALVLPTIGWTVSIGRATPLTSTELRLATGYCELTDQLGRHLRAEDAGGPATPR